MDHVHTFRAAGDACTAFATALSKFGPLCRGYDVSRESVEASSRLLGAVCVVHPVATLAAAHYLRLCRLMLHACEQMQVPADTLTRMRGHTEALMRLMENKDEPFCQFIDHL